MKTVQVAVASVLLALCSASWAQLTPVGTWRSVDDKTGEPKSEIQITESAGALEGRVTKLLRKDADPNAVCTECPDALKGKPMVGLPIITGAKQDGDKAVWVGGKILDPENGKSYTLRLTPIDSGKQLEVRGSIGPFGRTQTWVRVQ